MEIQTYFVLITFLKIWNGTKARGCLNGVKWKALDFKNTFKNTHTQENNEFKL